VRHFSEEAYGSLKRAVEVAYSLAGGVSLFAMVTRVKVPALSKYASPGEEHEETFMPIDVALDLDFAAKQPVVLTMMADLQGYDLVPKGEGIHSPRKVTDGDAIDLMSEAMDVVRALQTARADGRIDHADRKRVLSEIAQLERELDDLKLNLGEG
jgi:hypothetical protein